MYWSLKSCAQADSKRLMGLSKGRIHAENSLYGAAQLSGNRNENYTRSASDLYHAANGRFERIPLTAEDNANAIALVANLSAIEYLGRKAGYASDVSSRQVNGLHISPDQLSDLIAELQGDSVQLKTASPALLNVEQAARDARASDKSLIFVKDHALLPDSLRAAVLNEELNHAFQRAVTGNRLTDHLGATAQPFLHGRLAKRAALNLVNRGYQFRSLGHAAAEVGVRLMYPDGYKELGFTPNEADALGTRYVQVLRREYGNATADKIASRVTAATL